MRTFVSNQMRNIAPFLTLIILLVFFGVASRSFASWDNAANILTQISVTGVIAVGLTFVILCAEIDLSVAAIAKRSGIVVAYFTLQGNYVNIPNVPLPGARWRSSWPSPPAPSGLGQRRRHHGDRHSVLHHDASP
jgi:ribose transport system permease protein